MTTNQALDIKRQYQFCKKQDCNVCVCRYDKLCPIRILTGSVKICK